MSNTLIAPKTSYVVSVVLQIEIIAASQAQAERMALDIVDSQDFGGVPHGYVKSADNPKSVKGVL